MAIYQKMPRKGSECCILESNEGFFIEGYTYEDCLKELENWANNHPEKWIYVHNCGIGIANYCPISKYIIEVHIYDKKPANIILFMTEYQKGNTDESEIDFMSEEERLLLRQKQMTLLALLGSWV